MSNQPCVRFRSDLNGNPVKPGAAHIAIDYRTFVSEMEARMFAASLGACYGLLSEPPKGGWLTTADQRFSKVHDYACD